MIFNTLKPFAKHPRHVMCSDQVYEEWTINVASTVLTRSMFTMETHTGQRQSKLTISTLCSGELKIYTFAIRNGAVYSPEFGTE